MKLIVVELNEEGALTDRALSFLPAARRAELLALPPAARERSAFAELAARKELYPLDPTARGTPFSRTDRGKPYFPGCPSFRFSLSHSDGFAVCTVSEQPVGVDVEHMKKRRFGAIGRVFSPEEKAAIGGAADERTAFYRLWTARESFLKMCGVGLTGSKRVHISDAGVFFDGAKVPCKLFSRSLGVGQSRLLPPGEGEYALCVCAQPEEREPICEFYSARGLLSFFEG